MRFLWHVEDHLGAWMQNNEVVVDPATGVTHAEVAIEVREWVGGLDAPGVLLMCVLAHAYACSAQNPRAACP